MAWTEFEDDGLPTICMDCGDKLSKEIIEMDRIYCFDCWGVRQD